MRNLRRNAFARFDVMLSTKKVEYSYFLELDESITLIFFVCVWQKNLIAFSGELLVELASFSMIYEKKVKLPRTYNPL